MLMKGQRAVVEARKSAPVERRICAKDLYWSQEAMLGVKTRSPQREQQPSLVTGRTCAPLPLLRSAELSIRKTSCSKLLQENLQHAILSCHSHVKSFWQQSSISLPLGEHADPVQLGVSHSNWRLVNPSHLGLFYIPLEQKIFLFCMLINLNTLNAFSEYKCNF